jgi:hypothetical protein
MDQSPDREVRHLSGPGLLARLDKMVAARRITDEDAARLRAAAASGDLDAEAQQIRLRHARARVDAAVEDGRLTQQEADTLLERVQNGEHPRVLRGLRRR